MPLLEVKSLLFRFNGAHEDFLSGIYFHVNKGEIVAISGPSGCGKSTLLRCINGIYPHVNGGIVSGDILFKGKSIASMQPERRSALIGTVFQDFEAQIIHMCVEDELAFGPENMGMKREEIALRVRDVAEAIGLDPAAATSSLSGGNKQRLCVGGILTMRPEMLLLDEPLSNIDRDGVARLINFLVSLKKKGHSILLVEHRLDIILPYVDRALWMERGHIVERMPALMPIPVSLRKGPSHAKAMVKVRDLSYGYTRNEDVFSGVSFDIGRGEMAVVLGKNGCGKSTLLKILAGLLRPREGIIEIDGEDIRGKRPGFFRNRVGLVLQNPNHQLFMDTVRNEVLLNCGDGRAVDELLESFSLAHLGDRHPYSLSEGEKRRTALAAVLAARPSVLLLDEPTLGQDRDSLIKMIGALRRHSIKEGLTVLTVTHDEAAARALGDRVIMFYGGRAGECNDDCLESYFGAHARSGLIA